MAWVGGGLMLALLGLRARRSATSLGDFAQLLPFVGIRVLMPAVVVLPITGVWMVLGDSEWSFRQEWTRAAIGLFVVAFAIGAVYLSRLGIQMGRAGRLSGSSSSLATLVNRWLVAYGVVLVVLLLAVADMVFKPGS